MPDLTKSSKRTHPNTSKRFGLIKFKVVLLFIIVGSVPAIVVGAYAIHRQSHLVKKKIIHDQEEILSRKVRDVEIYLLKCKDDLRGLGAWFALNSLVAEISSQKNSEKINFWTDIVQQDFSRFAERRKYYTQIQFIDFNGKERIRVETVKGKSVISRKQELRNLANRPYFKRILSLKKDTFTILPQLTRTLQASTGDITVPTIRFGIPLTTHDGRKMGILVLTALAENFLDGFGKTSKGSMILADSSGGILYQSDIRSKNPTLNQESGKFQIPYAEAIGNEMQKTARGTIQDNSGKFVSYQKIDYLPNKTDAFWFGIYSRTLHATDRSELFESVIGFKRNLTIIIGIFLIIIIGGALLFGQKLTKQLLNIIGIAQAVTEGDLEYKKLGSYANDETGFLVQSLGSMIGRLRKNILSITKTATDITGSSVELSTAVQEQSAITAQQSASLTEITATLEELTTSSSQIADNSNSVVQISASALGESEKGMADIKMIQEKMDEIAEDNKASTDEIVDLGKKSKEIGKVMEIINTIADQTKLIAFNAAIEASSAGESGRRFEVVASEIRRLADSVMSSTEEIEGTIAEIRRAINRLVLASERGANRIKEGTELATKTFGQLKQLVAGARSTNDASTQISLSTQQQKSATNQVLNALKEIEQGFLEIAASIHETSGVSQDLTDSSTALKELVSEYKVTATTDVVDSK